MEEIRLNINGLEVRGRKGQTIVEVARENGIDIPTMCYDERVKIYGSCGVCLVEVEGAPKLLRACATEITEGMVVRTNTEKVRKARKVAFELLLSNHIGDCRPPCQQACPAHTDCQGYVGLIANGQYKEAVKLIKEQLPLPASIGRVCPHPCEDACRRQLVEEPIAIAWLKRFVADIDLSLDTPYMPEMDAPTGKKVAVVGGGPAGLSAAYYLAKAGHKVVIYEAMEKLGGMLRYGIPQYRLPKEVLDKEIELIARMGVEFVTNCRVGKDISLDYLRKNYDAVFIAIGAWKSSKLGCPGEELKGVVGGIEFLRAVTKGEKIEMGSKVAVVGGGNTAMDAARTAVRLGAKEVYVLYRRTKEEMPANEIEVIEAEEEGVKFVFLVAPKEIIGENGKVSAIKLQKMRLGEPDASGRRRPEPIPGEEMTLEVETVIAAIGQEVNIEGFEGLAITRKKTISVDEKTYATNIPGVFAGGDAVNEGPGIAIEAIADGKNAAEVIKTYLEGEIVPIKESYVVKREGLTREDFADREVVNRVEMPHLSPEERKHNFFEIVKGYTEEEAQKEAMRCLECGCKDYFECKLIKYANEYQVEPERFSGEAKKHAYKDEHPFIIRDPQKCILCGLCVRVCEEVMGVTALGFVNRGFETVIKPEFELALKDTSCISCGQCVAVCPTGALQERFFVKKPVPVKTEKRDTVCSFCGVGCNVVLDMSGDKVIRVLPNKESKVDGGHLCVKGRFGLGTLLKQELIEKPLINSGESYKEISYDDAINYVNRKIQGIKAQYGGDSIALFASPKLTNEELYLVKELAKKIDTPYLASFSSLPSGIKDVLGFDGSTVTLEEVSAADVILLLGCHLMEDYAVVGVKVRQALGRGAKLIVVNNKKTIADDWADVVIRPENDTDFIKAIIKALLEEGVNPGISSLEGFEDLRKSIENVVVSDEVKEIAKLYGKAKNAVVIFDHDRLTKEAERLIAHMAVVSGHIGRPRNGILMLRSKNNSQGLSDLGLCEDYKDILRLIEEGKIKAALVFGEDPVSDNNSLKDIFSKLEFLMVQDMVLTETAKLAEIVLPAQSILSKKGTFTSFEGRIQWYEGVENNKELKDWKVILNLLKSFGYEKDYADVEDITYEISYKVPAYRYIKLAMDKKGGIISRHDWEEMKKGLRLSATEKAEMFKDRILVDAVERKFMNKLIESGILK
ncbi:MAG: NAD(P)-binding protein [Thermovenabulum sp.]|uniref:NAD(P)-binding protein n=1 Tax=Thermovenabulum sp. TaxID=3100335 RepID=UPI003C7DA859